MKNKIKYCIFSSPKGISVFKKKEKGINNILDKINDGTYIDTALYTYDNTFKFLKSCRICGVLKDGIKILKFKEILNLIRYFLQLTFIIKEKTNEKYKLKYIACHYYKHLIIATDKAIKIIDGVPIYKSTCVNVYDKNYENSVKNVYLKNCFVKNVESLKKGIKILYDEELEEVIDHLLKVYFED